MDEKDTTSSTASPSEATPGRAESSVSGGDDAKDQSLLSDMKTVFHDTKTKDGKSIWKMTLETLGMADGKSKKTDRKVKTIEEGLTAIKELIAEAKEKEKTDDLKKKWDLPFTPFKQFNASYDNILEAFVKWARKEKEDSEGETEVNINISKAFRRFKTYVTWMDDNQETISTMDPEALTDVSKAFAMRITHDETGHAVWWLDFKKMDLDKFSSKTIPVPDVIRYMTYLCHIIIFDKKAQDNGLYFVEDCAKVGFWKMATAVPMEVSAQMDRLTIGCLPIKMNAIYIINAAGWMSLLMSLMKPFMSKKMRQRAIVVGKKDNAQEMIGKALGGPQYIPVDFCGLEGTLEKDVLSEHFKE